MGDPEPLRRDEVTCCAGRLDDVENITGHRIDAGVAAFPCDPNTVRADPGEHGVDTIDREWSSDAGGGGIESHHDSRNESSRCGHRIQTVSASAPISAPTTPGRPISSTT